MFLWIKALHIIAAISWMAGLLYLPRLYVYHSNTEVGSEVSETLKVMERKLLKYIMNPAMIATWVFGLWMIIGFDNITYYVQNGWFHVKLFCILTMTGFHYLFAFWRKSFECDGRRYSHKVFRLSNEGPTLLMIVIIIMVTVKPF